VKPSITVALAVVFAAPAAQGQGSSVPTVQPQIAAVPVIVLDFENSSRSLARNPYLTIYSDGRAVVSVPEEGSASHTGRIPPHELRDLLDDLFAEYALLECWSEELAAEIRQARLERRRPQPGPDAGTTIVRVRTKSGLREIRCHALGLTASQLPDLERVRRLFASQQRLQNVADIIRAGGYDRVEAVLSAANSRLHEQAPLVQSLTPRDLSLVDLRPDGSQYLQFLRSPDEGGLQPDGRFVMVLVRQSPGSEPEITVTADPS
jgi:hypothetical protein